MVYNAGLSSLSYDIDIRPRGGSEHSQTTATSSKSPGQTAPLREPDLLPTTGGSETLMSEEEKNEPVADFRKQAKLWPKGNTYEDFEVGMVFQHHWGRTLNEGDNSLFTTLTLHFNPLYFNEPYAKAHGHPGVVVNPLLVFNTVFGMSVEDLSEGGGPFLGVDAMTHHRPVHVGDTVYAQSEVVGKRTSEKFPGFGIVTWHTKGLNQDGEMVIDYRRTNLVRTTVE